MSNQHYIALGRFNKLTQAQVDAAIARYIAGDSLRKIAADLPCTSQSLGELLRNRNVPMRSKLCAALLRGEQSHSWRGDAAGDSAKRSRARKRYRLGKCNRCESPAVHRHHKDRNISNNSPENIEPLCRRCHLREHAEDRRIGQRGTKG